LFSAAKLKASKLRATKSHQGKTEVTMFWWNYYKEKGLKTINYNHKKRKQSILNLRGTHTT